MITTRIYRSLSGAVLSGILLALAPHSQAANLNYTVSLNTASLVGNANGPFSLDVALSSGSQVPNGLNTITLSNFVFLNGSVGAATYSTGGETGSMASSVTLSSSSFDNELAQSFSSSVTMIQFNVSMTNNTNNPFPDQFDVAVLDSGLNNIPTTDPSGGNTLVLANISSGQTLASVHAYQSTANGEAPGVTTAVPEPTSLASLLVAGLGAVGLGVRRKAFRRAAKA